MRKLYCLIVLLFVCFVALAQSDTTTTTTTKKDTTKKIKGVSFEQLKKDLSKGNPLFLLNGMELKDSISKKGFDELKPEEILSINVFKPTDAVGIYGKKGENGVVVINTKPTVKDLLLTNQGDTVSSGFPDSALYLIDGRISDKKLNGVIPADILSITVLKGDKASRYMESGNRNGTVLVITKRFAKKSYQEKLGAHCKKYLEYLQNHQNDDGDFAYVLNGIALMGNSDKMIKRLYDIPAAKIRSVKFMENTFRNGNKEKEIVVITTKTY